MAKLRLGGFDSIEVERSKFGEHAILIDVTAEGGEVIGDDASGDVIVHGALFLTGEESDQLIAMLIDARREAGVGLVDTDGEDFEVPMSVYARGRRPAPSHLSHLYEEE